MRKESFIADSLPCRLLPFPFFALLSRFATFLSNMHIERTNDGARRYLCTTLRFRCLHRGTSVCSFAPQINGSWAISRIVAVLFSRFRSIRRDATFPLCTGLRAKRFRALQRGTLDTISAAEWSRMRDKLRQMLRLLS